MSNRISLGQILVATGLLSALLAVLWVGRRVSHEPDFAVLPGIEGPLDSTRVGEAEATPWRSYAEGGPGRMAVLLTDTASAWLTLAHGLKTIGVPFRITDDHREAARHDVVLVYPTISGRVLSPQALRSLRSVPRRGGTLIGVQVEGGGMDAVFGFSDSQPSRSRREIVFDTTHPLARDFESERERRIPFSNPANGTAAAGSLGYLGVSDPLATFEDGTAAITSRRVGQGRTYAFGFDPGFLLLRGYANREEGLSRSYVNGFEPAADMVLRALLHMYEAGQAAAVTLHTVPGGEALAALITHDVDYAESLTNAAAFADYEAEVGVPATYFIQTKYVRDWNDRAFFDRDGMGDVRALADRGMEIASHSVAHSLQFNRAPLGTGAERYPTYRPFVQDPTSTEGATVLGELRVSRFLLESAGRDVTVSSFRPGHLRNPYTLPEALESTGYRFSSSVTAGNSLTHLPFRLTHGRGAEAAVDVFEFPVTVEDEETPLEDRVDETVALARGISEYGGSLVVLIHTDRVEGKLDFERSLVSALEETAWFGTVAEYGAWWSARDAVQLDVESGSGRVAVRLFAPSPIDGLALRMPEDYRVRSEDPAGLVAGSKDGRIVLRRLAGPATIILEPKTR